MVKYLDMSNNENKNQINNEEDENDEEVRCVCPNCNGEGWCFVSKDRAKELKKQELMEEACPFGDRCMGAESDDEDEEEDEEDEEKFEYENCSHDKSLTKICVGGGGMMNGNGSAWVELHNNKYYYVEYGNNPYKKYIGNKIIYDTEGYEWNFNVVEEDKDEKDEEDADEWLFNDNPQFYLMDKTNLDASLNSVNLDWSFEKPNVEYIKVYIFRSDKKK